MTYRRMLVLLLSSALAVMACGPDGAAPSECGTGSSCACQPGEPDCNPCQNGYRAALVGSACVPTCNAPDIDCGLHGACEETAQGAECRCEAGYTGASCSSCASGLKVNASGQCFGTLSAPGLLTLSTAVDEVVLGELVAPSWDFVPLVAVTSSVTDVAYAPASQTTYALKDGRLFSLDLETGAMVGLSAAGDDLGSVLCLDEAGQRAFTASAEAVYAVDLESFDVTEVATVGARALEYDAARGLVIGVDPDGATFELSGSEPVTLGQAPELESLAMAFDDASGRAYFLGSEAETEQARLLRYCADALSRLGAVPAWQTQLIAEAPADGDELYTLDYEEADSALVAIDLAATGVSTVRVTTAHPDAAVCIVAEGSASSELTVEVTEAARASFIVVVAPKRPVAIDMTARSEDAGSSVVVYTGEGLTITGPSAGVTEYENQAWANLGLTTLAKAPSRPTAQLVLMDWATQATLPLELTHRPVGAALAWVGEAP